MAVIQEGKAKLNVKLADVVSREMEVFYNPIMKLNRDITILLLSSVSKAGMRIGLPLEGTGIRGIRLLKEMKKGSISEIAMNDIKKDAYLSMKNNIRLNRLPKKKFILANKDANKFLLDSSGFDYVDIDPWGSPNCFLDSAIKRLSNKGILAVTATDTGCLAGSFPDACIRKYWAVPKRDGNMHETGIRILIRKVQLVAAQYDKALTPLFSFFRDHYYRIFFSVEKGRKKADLILKCHKMWNNAGPLWAGRLWDSKLASIMRKNNAVPDNQILLDTIASESKINSVGTFDIHRTAKKYSIKSFAKTNIILSRLSKKGFRASLSHFGPVSVRACMQEKKFAVIIRA